MGLSFDALRDRDLRAFAAALGAGAQGMVIGHALYSSDDFAAPASQSPFIVTEVLRRELGFRGLVITDDLGERAIPNVQSPTDAAVASLRAGADMVQVYAPVAEQRAVRAAIVKAVRDRVLTQARLDEAVLRVLAAKRALEGPAR